MTPPRPVPSTRDIVAGTEQRAAGRSPLVRSDQELLLLVCTVQTTNYRVWPSSCFRGGAAPNAPEHQDHWRLAWLFKGSEERKYTGTAASFAPDGLQTVQQQWQCVCIQESSHSPVHGKSQARWRTQWFTLCSLQPTLSRFTDKPITPATNQQQKQTALTHTSLQVHLTRTGLPGGRGTTHRLHFLL